jgi:endonuclease G, mitochondrial
VILEPGQRASDVTPSTPVLAVIMPNQAGVSQKRWSEYAVSIDEVERRTGYDYLSSVSVTVQQVLESRVAGN